MLFAGYFTVACAFGVWLLPEAVREYRDLPEPVRSMVAAFLMCAIMFWPAMVVYVYTYNDGRWK